tara:strand:- start:3082 stop:3552 length:471 start_codon:yes stop_codon:yes gene_type:complete
MNYANDSWNNVTKYLNMEESHKLQVSKDFKKIYQNKYNIRMLKEKYFIYLKDNWVKNNPNSVNVKILSLREYISNLKVEIYSEFKKDDVNDINEEKLSIYFNIYKTSVKQMKKLLLEKNKKSKPHQHQAYYNSGRQVFHDVSRDDQWSGWGQDYDY